MVIIDSHNKRVSGKLGGLFYLNRTDSGLVGLFGRDRSDPAAHAKHYVASKNLKKRLILKVMIKKIG
jgi:hypothetical protein